MKKQLFVWLPWRQDCPNVAYSHDAWKFHTRTAGIAVHGPCAAAPNGYQISGGRKCHATLEEAQRAALKALRASLRKSRRMADEDLAEAGG